ncbi:S-adenosyl-L-methionine-dependent methyltransferase [Pseudohyphozyma bogoriensis]|nr:S-adenosyl-L-methionine-dependent methyltransferase [Pseudohyphozyma bogoriensis]
MTTPKTPKPTSSTRRNSMSTPSKASRARSEPAAPVKSSKAKGKQRALSSSDLATSSDSDSETDSDADSFMDTDSLLQPPAKLVSSARSADAIRTDKLTTNPSAKVVKKDLRTPSKPPASERIHCDIDLTLDSDSEESVTTTFCADEEDDDRPLLVPRDATTFQGGLPSPRSLSRGSGKDASSARETSVELFGEEGGGLEDQSWSDEAEEAADQSSSDGDGKMEDEESAMPASSSGSSYEDDSDDGIAAGGSYVPRQRSRISPAARKAASSQAKRSAPHSPTNGAPRQKRRASPYVLIPPPPKRQRVKLAMESDLHDLFDDSTDSDIGTTLPTRNLTSFTLYDSHGTKSSLLDIRHNRGKFSLVGLVTPRHLGQGVSKIKPVHTRINGVRNFRAFGEWELWVETRDGWYVLGEAAAGYVESFDVAKRYLSVFMAARSFGLTNRIRMKEFKEGIAELELETPKRFAVEIPLSGEDVAVFRGQLLDDVRDADATRQAAASASQPLQLSRRVYALAAKHFKKGAFACVDKRLALQDAEARERWKERDEELLKRQRKARKASEHPYVLRDRNSDNSYDRLRNGPDTYVAGDCVRVLSDRNEICFAQVGHGVTFADASTIEDAEEPRNSRCRAAGKRYCVSCERDLNLELFNTPVWSPSERTTFVYQGTTYHLGDFVLIFVNDKTPYEVGRLEAIGGVDRSSAIEQIRPELHPASLIRVRYFKRLADLGTSHDPLIDDRELVWTDLVEISDVTYLKGTCVVEHLDDVEDLVEFRKRGARFYISRGLYQETPVETITELKCDPKASGTRWKTIDANKFRAKLCRLCEDERLKEEQFNRTQPPLVGIDLFAGGGGFSWGMKEAGVKTVYAVDSDRSATRVYSLNHPSVKADQRDINAALLDLQKSKLPLLKSMSSPLSEGIDVVYGSPPCCSFSKANRRKDSQDTRSALTLVLLSFVELLRPDYVVIENVPTAMHAELRGKKKGSLLDLWKAILFDLGYQLEYGTMSADSVGVPQLRERFFLIATKTGRPKAEFPKGFTISWASSHNISQVLDGKTSKIKTATQQGGAAPHRTPAFLDLASDLPQFGIKSPETITKDPLPDLTPPSDHLHFQPYDPEPIDFLNVHDTAFDSYLCDPITPYQQAMRRIPESSNVLQELTSHQVERLRDADVAEALCHVPPEGRFEDLPEIIQGRFVNRDHRDFARIIPTQPAQTIIGSVRARPRRIQGLPDSFQLSPQEGQPISLREQRLITGNMVCPPVAYAIGLELSKAAFKAHLEGSE